MTLNRFYVLRHGYFFRPNACGYTTDIDAAGLFTEEEADRYSQVAHIAIRRASLHDIYGKYDLVFHLDRQRYFSLRTFGPGTRTKGVCDHIRKELDEVAESPNDLEEWVDVILLALDGAWRAGHSSVEIAAAIDAKQSKNEARDWPDWRTQSPDKAIEHVRD